MKAAKEWAAEVADEHDGVLVLYHLGGGRAVAVDVDVDASELEEVIYDARTIIERLVERVQADANSWAIALVEAYAAVLSCRNADAAKEADRVVALLREKLKVAP